MKCAASLIRRIGSVCVVMAAVAAAGPGTDGPALAAQAGWPELPPEMERVRDAMKKYQDPAVAVRDGYWSTLGCVMYPEGGMGIHFVNMRLIGPEVDPMKPQILLYEPAENGELTLVGVEYFVPLATGIKQRPTVFGQPFEGPMEGHEPLMPKELHHYDLHVWLFRENPKGVFNTVNPDVDCGDGPYVFHEGPTASVPHH